MSSAESCVNIFFSNSVFSSNLLLLLFHFFNLSVNRLVSNSFLPISSTSLSFFSISFSYSSNTNFFASKLPISFSNVVINLFSLFNILLRFLEFSFNLEISCVWSTSSKFLLHRGQISDSSNSLIVLLTFLRSALLAVLDKIKLFNSVFLDFRSSKSTLSGCSFSP